jgi:N6-L-threonylcarbamoyladenine synthase
MRQEKPAIENLAKKGDEKAFNFPRPMIGSKDFDFSFSGLKAAVWRETKKIGRFDDKTIADICACVQKSIIEVLVRKTIKAAKETKAKSILLGGGVAANQKLRSELKLKIDNLNPEISFFFPEKILCTDNAAMIGAYAVFHPERKLWSEIYANPELYFQ